MILIIYVIDININCIILIKDIWMSCNDFYVVLKYSC
jgi:hypothetical protein